jgi:hypothetical protein
MIGVAIFIALVLACCLLVNRGRKIQAKERAADEARQETIRDFEARVRKSKLSEFQRVHGDLFDYSNAVLFRDDNSTHLVSGIVCPKHGAFGLTVKQHLDGRGCPTCSISMGERTISKLLRSNGIEFSKEAKLIPKSNYRFDFVLPDRKTIIEYHGAQHYRPVEYFGGEPSFRKTQERDGFKQRWAVENGYTFVTIPYLVSGVSHIALFLEQECGLQLTARD